MVFVPDWVMYIGPMKSNPQLPVSADPMRLGGAPCFVGTRVPVDALFSNLEAGMSIDEFLSEFEGVGRGQVLAVLENARQAYLHPQPA